MRGKNLWAICLALLTLMGSGVPVNAAETDIAENELLQEVVSNVGRESKRQHSKRKIKIEIM